ncbi:glycosyltransferase family 4 protein [Armatimonas rosea]|uniref:UDP-GlcNAc:undecaprenyl-phosphate GlcNAc-1-phosphate transferase n=1 Tax=Armatimonas rosea TaxID=685828 RepID=A0A7W9SRM3_ARMRO|nr:MraY family glycosyltransferase [Armatimonas rosea]MBB6051532.1 UDP-GlcNAc:undecaprenyl-phosphate GlcNAc-1-phosphate transferase [Armatimonas rosea]
MNLLTLMASATALACVVTILLTPLAKRLAERFGVVRVPRVRDAHHKATPLWGGTAIVVGFFAAYVALRLFTNVPFDKSTPDKSVGGSADLLRHPIVGILLGALIVSVIGALDDMPSIGPKDAEGKSKGLSPTLQILGLLFAGLVAALFGARIEGVTNPFPNLIHVGPYLSLGWLSIPLTMVWVLGATKFFDFLDGMDGLAAGVSAIAAMTMGVMAAFSHNPDPAVALLAAATFGAALGFLRYNYNPASIFMGTVGSYFLGFMLSMLAVVGALKVPVAAAIFLPGIVLGVPVFDGLYVIRKRAVQGKKLTEADQSHLHHRLTERGLSVKQAVWIIYGLTFVTCLIALLLVWLGRKP